MSCIHVTLFCSALFGAIAIAIAPLARADFCPDPPDDAWKTDSGGTNDDAYTNQWCWSGWQTLWNGLHLDETDWDEGHGAALHQGQWVPTCGSDDHLTRLLNGAHLVRMVTEHAIPYGLHRPIQDPDNDLSFLDVDNNGRFRGNWWLFTESHEPDEWVPGCETSGTLATNHTGIDDYIELHKTSAYRNRVIHRASTIVHETVHEDVSHIGDSDCWAGGSCDDQFGRYNAQTMQIHFLYDAASSYKLVDVNGQKVRRASVAQDLTGRICSYDPTFSTAERNAALTRANTKRSNNFFGGPAINMDTWTGAGDADDATNETWSCNDCNPSEWTFDPGTCQQKACNEHLNPNNIAINANNAATCEAYNAEIAAGQYAQEAIELAKNNATYQSCQVPTPAGASAYCDAEIAAAADIDDVDSCHHLEGVYGPGFSRKICLQRYCRQAYLDSGGAGWFTSGDPYGCLEAICIPDGEARCWGSLPVGECVDLVLAAHADPEYYDASCSIDSCERVRNHCISDHIQNGGTWEHGDSVPQHCLLMQEVCELAESLSAEVMISMKDLEGWRIPDIGPVTDTMNPGLLLPGALLRYREMVHAGASADELAQQRAFMLSEPEMLRALFDMMPGRFAAMFDARSVGAYIGPDMDLVTPEPIAPEHLDELGRAALAELEELMPKLEELGLPAFGPAMIQSQQQQIDTDLDGIADFQDNCAHWANFDQRDGDGNGTGNACECGDQDGNGTVDIRDALEINAVIFGRREPGELCDANADGACDVRDILAVNARIFGADTHCAQNPPATWSTAP